MPTTRLTQSGAIELPADLRQRLGLLEGDEVVLEERDGGLFLRAAVRYEIWTPERKAEFFLNNSVTQEDYDQACADIREMGLDPTKIPFTESNMRETLPTRAQLEADAAPRWIERATA
jgi:AbrB family looped-hinge helix DNA binding protein